MADTDVNSPSDMAQRALALRGLFNDLSGLPPSPDEPVIVSVTVDVSSYRKAMHLAYQAEKAGYHVATTGPVQMGERDKQWVSVAVTSINDPASILYIRFNADL